MADLLASDAEAKVVVIDNHGFFPTVRLVSMLLAYPNVTEDTLEYFYMCMIIRVLMRFGCRSFLERVQICYSYEVNELVDFIESLMSNVDLSIKLIVIDNISYFFRSYLSCEMDEKMCALRYVGMLLRQLARKCSVPVLLNNHLTTAWRIKDRKESGTEDVPYLGDTWTLMVDVRLRVRYKAVGSKLREVLLGKSTYSVSREFMHPATFSIEVAFKHFSHGF